VNELLYMAALAVTPVHSSAVHSCAS
jgi:hypothetical protein